MSRAGGEPPPTEAEATEAEPPATRQRRVRARVSPQALAARRRDAREGLDWLGGPPEARAGLVYRLARLFARALLFGAFRFHVTTSGQEELPRGGYIVVVATHRGWIDPFVVLHALPLEPRAWFLGSAASTFTSRWREALIRRIGGLLPVWRGGVGIEQHLASARAVLANGAVFVQMPEGTVSGPAGRIGPFRTGAGLIALRTGATIVPLAIAGTEELYIGRRMASRVLPPVRPRDLVPGWDGVPPPAGSREELDLARRITEGLAAILGPVVEELQPATVDPPGRRRLLRRRLTWLFLAPGPLDRDLPA